MVGFGHNVIMLESSKGHLLRVRAPELNDPSTKLPPSIDQMIAYSKPPYNVEINGCRIQGVDKYETLADAVKTGKLTEKEADALVLRLRVAVRQQNPKCYFHDWSHYKPIDRMYIQDEMVSKYGQIGLQSDGTPIILDMGSVVTEESYLSYLNTLERTYQASADQKHLAEGVIKLRMKAEKEMKHLDGVLKRTSELEESSTALESITQTLAGLEKTYLEQYVLEKQYMTEYRFDQLQLVREAMKDILEKMKSLDCFQLYPIPAIKGKDGASVTWDGKWLTAEGKRKTELYAEEQQDNREAKKASLSDAKYWTDGDTVLSIFSFKITVPDSLLPTAEAGEEGRGKALLLTKASKAADTYLKATFGEQSRLSHKEGNTFEVNISDADGRLGIANHMMAIANEAKLKVEDISGAVPKKLAAVAIPQTFAELQRGIYKAMKTALAQSVHIAPRPAGVANTK